MKRIIIIAVLAYLVYYLYNKKNAGASATTKGTGNNLDVISGKLYSAIGAVTPTMTVTDPSPAEISLVDPVGTSNANIAALQTPVIPLMDRIVPIMEERVPYLTGDTPYWMPNQEMIYPHGYDQYNTL